ncbi:MAG: AzlC family ABC transporter permease [Thermoleophilia bacterium]
MSRLPSDLRAVLAAAVSLGLAVGVFGFSFGVLAAATGLTPARAVAMSSLVFTGSAQYAAVSAVAMGASAATAVTSGLLLNTRCLAFGLTVAPHLGGRWTRRLLGAHLVIDESTAMAAAATTPGRARWAFWATGVSVFVCWNAATLAGVLAQSAIGDPRDLGLDAVFPAAFIALLVPLVRGRAPRVAALAGGAVALAAVPVLTPGLPVTAGALGVAAGLAVERRR